MKRTMILFFLFVNISICYSQNDSITLLSDTAIYSTVDEFPTFPADDSVLVNFIKEKFVYTEMARQQGTIAKTTRVSFVVTSTGKIKNVKVVEPDKRSSSFDNQVASVVEKMPDWRPGKIDGVPVNVKYIMDIYIDTKFRSSIMYGNKVLGGYDGERKVVIKHLTLISHIKTKADDAYNRGVQKSQEKNYQGAINDFTETLKYNPRDIDALYNRAAMKLKLKDIIGACEDWSSIKRLGSSDADQLLIKYCSE